MRLVCLFLCLTLVSCQQGYQSFRHPLQQDKYEVVKNRKIIKVGILKNVAPYVFNMNSDEWMGFEIDLINAIVADHQYKVEIIHLSHCQVKEALAKNTIDLCLGLNYKESLDNGLDYSIPYFNSSLGLLVAKNITDEEQVSNQKVAYIKGLTDLGSLTMVSYQCEAYKSTEGALAALQSGKVKGIIATQAVLNSLQSENYHTLDLGQNFESYIVVADNQSRLRDMVNAKLMHIWENGVWQDSYETWFGDGSLFKHEADFHINVIPR